MRRVAAVPGQRYGDHRDPVQPGQQRDLHRDIGDEQLRGGVIDPGRELRAAPAQPGVVQRSPVQRPRRGGRAEPALHRPAVVRPVKIRPGKIRPAVACPAARLPGALRHRAVLHRGVIAGELDPAGRAGPVCRLCQGGDPGDLGSPGGSGMGHGGGAVQMSTALVVDVPADHRVEALGWVEGSIAISA